MNLLKHMQEPKLRSNAMLFKKIKIIPLIFRANKDNTVLKAQCNSLEIKQGAITKRLEIKIAALENALEQKNRECEELAALCDEVTGKKV